MKTELRFRVNYGFTALEKISIDETELEKAVYAHKYCEVVQLSNRQINGKYIIDIMPDIHYYTGWYDSYSPSTGEDFAQIKRDCPEGLDEMIKKYREKIDYLISTGRKNLIGKNVSLPELDQPREETKQLPADLQKISGDIANKFKIN